MGCRFVCRRPNAICDGCYMNVVTETIIYGYHNLHNIVNRNTEGMNTDTSVGGLPQNIPLLLWGRMGGSLDLYMQV